MRSFLAPSVDANARANTNTNTKTIIEISSSSSNDSSPPIPLSNRLRTEKGHIVLTLEDIQSQPDAMEEVEGTDLKANEGEEKEEKEEEEEEEEEEVIEVRKTRKRSAIEKFEKRAPKHIERVTTLRSRRQETGEDWSLAAVLDLVQSFFGPSQIVLDDDEEELKNLHEGKASVAKEGDASKSFAPHDPKVTLEFIKKFDSTSSSCSLV